MRYVAKQAREGINVSKTHPLVEAGTLVAGLSILFGLGVVALIFLVEVSLYFISPQAEAEFFDRWMPEDLIAVSEDDERRAGTQLIVDRLALHWPDSPYQFRVEIDESEQSNAMALPGGLIIVTQGLLDQVESENELAFVLGHELGHFHNRDHLRALGRGAVLSIVFAVVTGGDVAGIGVRIADLTLRGFSRAQESDADEFGLQLVHAEYAHVGEAWRLFERWHEYEGESLIEFVTYLSTHPQTGERIDELREFAVQNSWPVEGELTPLAWTTNP